jgi:putative aldouronate transport system substrate-binding protein
MKKKIVLLMSIILVFAFIFNGCAVKEVKPDVKDETSKTPAVSSPFEQTVKFSVTTVQGGGNNISDYENDSVYKILQDKFNLEIELIQMDNSTLNETNRLWITSGDMVDAMFWNFNPIDYEFYIEEDLIRELPENIEKKYPNMWKVLEKGVIGVYLKNLYDGKLYCTPNTKYIDEPTKTSIDGYTVYYRKDWAQKLGIEVKERMTVDEIVALGRAFVEEDPGENGKGKTIGITSTANALYDTFVKKFNKHYNVFFKDKSEYKWGARDADTVEGIKYFKDLYVNGIVDRDYYTIKAASDFTDKFYAGKAGIMIQTATVENYNGVLNNFAKSNPGMNSDETIGICCITSNEGKYLGNENTNYWGSYIYKSNLDDITIDRILSLYDFIATDEGQKLANIGVENEDYTINNNGEITVTRAKNEDGTFRIIHDIHPLNGWLKFSILNANNWTLSDPGIQKNRRDNIISLMKSKDEVADLVKLDYDLILYNGENYKNLKIVTVVDAITELIISNEDVDKDWKKYLDECKNQVDGALIELNRDLIK